MYNILCKYFITKEEKSLLFCYSWGSIIFLSFYFRGIYEPSFKMANTPQTLILRIFVTVKNEIVIIV
jgi:hypothetical protein